MTAVAIIGLATITMAQVPNYVPTNGLSAWWPFNGNAEDESVNANDGTVNGATLTTDRFGNVDSAYNFNGSSSFIEVPSSPTLEVDSAFSISVWFNTALLSFDLPLDEHTIISKVVDGGWYGGYQIDYFGSDGYIRCMGNIGGVNIYPSPGDAVIDTWFHVVYTYDGEIVRLYLNGIETNTEVHTGDLQTSSNPVRFGRRAGAGTYNNWFNGKIDDIGIWGRALTQCEIQDLYASQLNSTFVNAGTDQTICNGEPVTLSAINSLNYSWDNGVTDGVAFNPTATQDYTVSADSAGCLSSDVVTVTVNEHTTATQTQTALDTYTWPINSQTYTQSGTYTAVIPNAAGCDSTITLDLSLDFTGLEENSQGESFSVFPNPAQSVINVNADNKLIGEIYTIYDNKGRVVLTGKLNSQNTTIELGNLSGGIYMFSVGENMKQSFKVIKE